MATSVTLSAVEAALIETVIPGVEDTLEKEDATWKKWKRGSADDTNSRGAALVLGVTNNASFKTTSSEGADFANPGAAGLVKTTVPATYVYKTGKFSGQVMAQEKASRTLVQSTTYELDNMAANFDKQMNRFAFGDASGELARVSGVSSLVVTCNGTTNLYGSRLIEVGMEVEFRTSAGVLRSGGGVNFGVVNDVATGSKTFTVDQIPSDAASTDVVYFRGSYNTAPRGLTYHVADSGAWQGISDRTDYRGTSAVVEDASTGDFTPSLLDKVIGNMAYKVGKKAAKSKILSAPSQIAKYKSSGYDLKNHNSTSMDGSFDDDGLSHANWGFEQDIDCPVDSVFLGDISVIQRFEMQKAGFQRNPAGGIFFQANASAGVGHADAALAYMKWYGNFGTKKPRLLARIKSLSTSGLPLGHQA